MEKTACSPAVGLGVTSETVTGATMQSFSAAQHPRLAKVLPLLVKHLHAFVKEAQVNQLEWQAGLKFLTECSNITSDERNEFVLLSDILGISSLVDLQAHSAATTPGSVLGPFHNLDSRLLESGVDLIQGQAGTPVVLLGRVCHEDGTPAQAANVDFWQNADNGLYPAQDPAQDPHNLRCKMKCDALGRFVIRTVAPKPYRVPYDGPVGKLLEASNRHCWRPAHFHLIAAAADCRTLVTELFPAQSAYLDSDAVFGVRDALVLPMPLLVDPEVAQKYGVSTPFHLVEFEIRLASLSPQF